MLQILRIIAESKEMDFVLSGKMPDFGKRANLVSLIWREGDPVGEK
jgi:hypothetical protein